MHQAKAMLFAAAYSCAIIARQDALRNFQVIPDPLWKLARVSALINLAIRQYGAGVLDTALKRGRVTLHIPSGSEAGWARLILLQELGTAYRHAYADAQNKQAIPPLLRPDAWLRGERMVAIEAHIEYSSLWKPFDPPTRYISITLTISQPLTRNSKEVHARKHG
jgi:hypothetical protein